VLIGTNTFRGSAVCADLTVVPKPPAGTACPRSVSAFRADGLKDGANGPVITPVPANQVDASAAGYVVARNGTVPADRLWVFAVRRAANGAPAIDALGRSVAVPRYVLPPDATQPGSRFRIRTLDARNTQAVLARNPRRADGFSLWTQHTVGAGATSAVRWYEIDPAPATPTVRRTGLLGSPTVFLFNAAISSDRRVDGTRSAFGGSFVVGYSASSAAANILPRIMMVSSRNGGPVASVLVRPGSFPLTDETCTLPGQAGFCRRGAHAGAAPDPRPTVAGTGVVWLTNQLAGRPPSAPPAVASGDGDERSVKNLNTNWRTWIWAARP
jgi:hypothetical protein